MEGQTDKLIVGGLTDILKNRHTDEQLIDQTYIQTDRDLGPGSSIDSASDYHARGRGSILTLAAVVL